MNIPADTLEDEVEPFLLREGFIQRTPRGRTITARALAHLGTVDKAMGRKSAPRDRPSLF
jgi:Holliday junction DNA helicase RuvB